MAIDLLKRSRFLDTLDDRVRSTLARQSRFEICQAGEALIVDNEPAQTSYVLAAGTVVVYVSRRPGRHCGGEGVTLLTDEGSIFGWGPVARPDRLTISAWSVGESKVLAVNVGQSPSSGATLRFFRGLAASLFALLQDLGLCPLDREALEHMTQPSMPCGVEECINCYRPAAA